MQIYILDINIKKLIESMGRLGKSKCKSTVTGALVK